jgi:hypothetical protein
MKLQGKEPASNGRSPDNRSGQNGPPLAGLLKRVHQHRPTNSAPLFQLPFRRCANCALRPEIHSQSLGYELGKDIFSATNLLEVSVVTRIPARSDSPKNV